MRPSAADESTPRTYADLRSEWHGAPAEFFERDGVECLRILGAPVMEDWEAPYMAALAGVACAHGGRVLEVGFGLGLSAHAIDALGVAAGVTEHVIFEANAEVAKTARDFAESAQVPTTVIEGFWQDAVHQLEPASFSGILFDVFPLQKAEV